MMKRILFIAGLLVQCLYGFTQTDTSFWFVAPDCTSSHAQSPNYFRITAQGLPATVTISQPANPSFTPIVVNIAANSVSTIDVTSRLNMIENAPYNQVLNYGIKISATNLITAYYEQASNLNPDIFPLKGKNALGTEFLIPAQNTWSNGTSYNPVANNKFDIVATEDNTTVTITPSNNIVGRAAGIPFTITLNKGQTYCAAATNTNASSHLAGSAVSSNKPIAITMSDDSITDGAYGGCADLAGDQIVPISLLGMKYISIHGYLTGANDKVFIMAVQDATEVRVNGTTVALLNKGQVYNRASNGAPMYIEANKPVSALHISGFGCEVGGAILPQIECTGSKAVGVTRSDNQPIYFNILVPTGGEGNFTYNGNITTINASQFQFVPGSANTWKYARINMGSILSAGSSAYIVNSSSNFHLALIHGDASTGCRYGYFSDYNRFEATGNSNSPLCEGNNLQLNCNVTGSVADVTFQWTGPNGFVSTQQNPIINNITSAASGLYTCVATKSGCPAIPININVAVNAKPLNTASSNAPVCEGNTINFSTATVTGANYLWTGPNGFTSNLQNPTIPAASNLQAGMYTLVVTNNGCTTTENTSVVVNAAPTAAAANSGPYCEGQTVSLNGSSNNAGVSYNWAGPNSFTSNLQNPSISVAQQNASGVYTLTVSQAGCSDAVSTTTVTVNPGPGATVTGNSPLCENNTILLAGVTLSTGVTWNWTGPNGFTSNQQNVTINNATPTQSGNYILAVSKSGCTSTFSYTVLVNTKPIATPASNSPLCDGADLNFTTQSGNGFAYSWTGPNSFSSNLQNPQINNATLLANGLYTLTVSAQACADAVATTMVTIKPTPYAIISTNSPVCTNQTLQLNATNSLNGTLYTWSGPNSFSSSLQNSTIINPSTSASGSYTLTTSLNGCTSSANVSVLVKATPSAQIAASFPACRFSNTQLTNNNTVANTVYSWTGPNGYSSSQQNITINNFGDNNIGKYYLVATSNGCIATDSMVASLKESPVIDFPPITPICQEENGFQISATETTGISGGIGLFTGNGTNASGFFNPSVAGAGDHIIRYSFNASNGCSAFKEQIITVYPTPVVDAGPNKVMLQGGGVKLDASVTGIPASIKWSPANGLDNPGILQPLARPNANQTYLLEVQTTDGCYAADTVFVKVLGNIKIPNVFTPNGDGINDKWNIDGLPAFSTAELFIYNRYGQEIFRSTGYAKSWDGTFKGKPVPVGTYYYLIYLNDGFRSQPFAGWVAVLR